MHPKKGPEWIFEKDISQLLKPPFLLILSAQKRAQKCT